MVDSPASYVSLQECRLESPSLSLNMFHNTGGLLLLEGGHTFIVPLASSPSDGYFLKFLLLPCLFL